LIFSQIIFCIPNVKGAEEIKIVYGMFSRTITTESLEHYAKTGEAEKNLKKILDATGSSNEEILNILNQDFSVPIVIASKLMYSEIGNVILRRISKVIYPERANIEKASIPALRASVIKGLVEGEQKINLMSFLKSYPNKKLVLNITAMNKIINKVESISELFDFFTDSPLEKLKES